MGNPLYLEDSYLRECDAVVESVKDEKFIILDKTIFYPRGGGQPSDTGKLVTDSGLTFSVLFVGKFEGKISHEVEPNQEGKLTHGDKVRCVLDWDKRYTFMRMHTAAHLLAATMNKELGVLITGNQIGEEKTRFDFNTEEFDREKFEQIVLKANELLNQDLELKIYTLPREKAMEIPGIVKLANALPPSIKELRIVEIPGIDIQADAGTHVKNLNEVGSIELLKCENKGKNNRRIYFALK